MRYNQDCFDRRTSHWHRVDIVGLMPVVTRYAWLRFSFNNEKSERQGTIRIRLHHVIPLLIDVTISCPANNIIPPRGLPKVSNKLPLVLQTPNPNSRPCISDNNRLSPCVRVANIEYISEGLSPNYPSSTSYSLLMFFLRSKPTILRKYHTCL